MSAFLQLVLKPTFNVITPELPPFFFQNRLILHSPIRRQRHPDLSCDAISDVIVNFFILLTGLIIKSKGILVIQYDRFNWLVNLWAKQLLKNALVNHFFLHKLKSKSSSNSFVPSMKTGECLSRS